MAFPPDAIASDKTTNTPIFPGDHPDHHNALAIAVNDVVSEIQTWTVDRDAGGKRLDDVAKVNVGTGTDNSLVTHMELAGSSTWVAGEHVVMVELDAVEATFNTTNGGSWIGIHITPNVLGNASVTEIVGIQSQVSSITDVTTQIHAVEALVNFGYPGKTAAMSRSVWAQTVAQFGTITDGIGLDATGGSGLGTITTMYGVRIGRTSGSLMLQGSTIYGIYVNQGSVRNYLGGDTRLGGGTNGDWANYRVLVDANGVSFNGTDHPGIKLNGLTTTQRDALTPAAGMVVWNTTTTQFEGYDGSAWVGLGQVAKAATLGGVVQTLTSPATNDDPVEQVVQARVATTDATVTTLHTFTIPASTTVMVDVRVTARRTGGIGGSAEDGAGYIRYATFKNVAGTAGLIGTVSLPYTQESQAGWDCTLVASGATALVRVTGAANNNVTWHMTARVYSVSS